MKKEAGFSTGAWIFLSVLLLVTVFLTGSYLASVSTREQQQNDSSALEDEQVRKNMEDWQRQNSLSECLTKADEEYKKQWDESAAVYGAGDKLPTDQAELLDNRHDNSRQECHTLYS